MWSGDPGPQITMLGGHAAGGTQQWYEVRSMGGWMVCSVTGLLIGADEPGGHSV